MKLWFNRLAGAAQSVQRRLAASGDNFFADLVMRRYFFALLIGHVFCYAYFLTSGKVATLLNTAEPLCWPFFQECWRFRFSSEAMVHALFGGYLAAVVLTALAARFRRWNVAYWMAWALVLTLAAIVSLDYRFRQNQYYMFLWANVVALAWPARRASLALVIISFYFWAGRLKLNHEWLSGSVLYKDLWLVPKALTTAACAYVVVLEMVLIWGLMSRRAWLRWLTLGQLALFHVESFSQIDWFYPLIMTAILSFFPILWHVEQGPGDRSARPAWALAGVFAVFQLIPLMYRGVPAFTGQGRMFALHMFEARQICDVTVRQHVAGVSGKWLNLKLPLPPRMICDPLIYFDRASNICRTRRDDPSFVDIDLRMRIKLTTEDAYTEIIAEDGFCAKHHEYKVLGNNAWLRFD